MEIIRKMDDIIIKKYTEYKDYIFKKSLIKEDTFTLKSFIDWLKEDKKEIKPLIDESLWFEIESKYNGVWIK